MMAFSTIQLNEAPVVKAPDGSRVALLPVLHGGSMAHFSLEAGQCTQAVKHRTVEEIWFVTKGFGQLWRKQNDREECVDLSPGTALTLPEGTAFQFRAAPHSGLEIIAITMPPWPGEEEAISVAGPWLA